MPVNLAEMDANLRTVEQQASGELTAPLIRGQLEMTLKSLRDTAIQTDPNPIEIPTHNTLEFAQAGLTAKLSPRQWRHQTINEIERLIERLNQAHPHDRAEQAHINQIHKWNADLIREVCAYDIDPVQVLPFRQTARGRDTLTMAAKEATEIHGHDIRKGREHINRRMTAALADHLQQHINEQFPVATGRTAAPVLSERDVLTLGKDVWDALSEKHDNPATQTATLLKAGCDQNRWQVDQRFLTSSYWIGAHSTGFDLALPAHSELSAITRIQDQILPWDALEIVRGSSSRFEFSPNKPTVQFIDSGNPQEVSQLQHFRQEGKNTKVMVAPDRNGEPMMIAPWSADTPNYYLVTAPWKLYQILRVDEGVDGKDRLAIFQNAAETLGNNRNAQWVGTQVEALSRRWKELPTNAPEYLKDELRSIQSDLTELATHLPPPGHGSKEQLDAARNLIKLMTWMPTSDPGNTLLTFRLPTHRGTCPDNQRPNALVDRHDNGDGTSDITWHTIGDSGIASPESFNSLRNVLNHEASSAIANEALKGNYTYGATQPGAPGFNVHTPSHNGASPYVGHWMTQEDRKALTQRSVASLRSWMADPDDPALRDNFQADLAAYAIVELVYGQTISSQQADNVYDGLIFDGDLILDATSDNPGRIAITLPKGLTRIAAPEEIKAALSQQVALNPELAPDRAQEILGNIQRTDWTQAIETAEALNDLDTNPGLRL